MKLMSDWYNYRNVNPQREKGRREEEREGQKGKADVKEHESPLPNPKPGTFENDRINDRQRHNLGDHVDGVTMNCLQNMFTWFISNYI